MEVLTSLHTDPYIHPYILMGEWNSTITLDNCMPTQNNQEMYKHWDVTYTSCTRSNKESSKSRGKKANVRVRDKSQRTKRGPYNLLVSIITFTLTEVGSHWTVLSREETWSGFANKGLSSQGYGFSSGHVWMWELEYKEGWALKNWCFWTVVLEKTLESSLDCKEIHLVYPKGD